MNARKIQCLKTIPIALALSCIAILPRAQAVVPAPDGGYPGANTAEGTNALFKLTNGYDNTAVGYQALYSNTTGPDNTAVGATALQYNTAGFANTAVGQSALNRNISGFFNTADGFDALMNNTIGYSNTATGSLALISNTTGDNNTASGAWSLFSNTSGGGNTASGYQALYNNNGYENSATGDSALYHNTTGDSNVATGFFALYHNTAGNDNTATGAYALYSNTTGNNNVGIGLNAGYLLTTGVGNVCIGWNVQGVAGESNTTRIRNVYSSIANGRAVYVNSDNKIGTLASSRRYKEEIKPMDKASEPILALKPVTFRYKKKIDASGTKQFGLVAEEVEKVNPDLVTRDKEGNPETVRYEAVNAMLLNEFLKEHRRVEELQKDFEATGAQQEKEIKALIATVKEQASQIQKVSAELPTGSLSAGRLEASKSAPRIVFNNQ